MYEAKPKVYSVVDQLHRNMASYGLDSAKNLPRLHQGLLDMQQKQPIANYFIPKYSFGEAEQKQKLRNVQNSTRLLINME